MKAMPVDFLSPASLTPDQTARSLFNRTSVHYIGTLKELQNLESNPFHDKSHAAALKERLDSLYAELEGIATENPHLSLELPSLEEPPKTEQVQTMSIEEWKISRPEEYAIFTRFEEAKRKYIVEAKEVQFLKERPLEELRDRGIISHLNENLERRYRWLQEYAEKNSSIVLEIPPRLHSYQVQGGIKI